MTRWTHCGPTFIAGDVIRWVERVWNPPKRKGDRAKPIGARLVTGQVLECDAEWARFQVLECQTQAIEGVTIDKLEGAIKRKRSTIGQGGGQRLRHADESARAISGSRFLNEAGEIRPDAAAPALTPDNWPPKLTAAKGGGARTPRSVYRKPKPPRQRPSGK